MGTPLSVETIEKRMRSRVGTKWYRNVMALLMQDIVRYSKKLESGLTTHVTTVLATRTKGTS